MAKTVVFVTRCPEPTVIGKSNVTNPWQNPFWFCHFSDRYEVPTFVFVATVGEEGSVRPCSGAASLAPAPARNPALYGPCRTLAPPFGAAAQLPESGRSPHCCH